MKVIAEWEIKLKKAKHTVVLKRNYWTGKHLLLIDEVEKPVIFTWQNFFKGLDMPFTIKDEDLRLIILGNKRDLVIDGKYLSNGAPYEPVGPLPGWAWIFIVLCAALPVLSLGGVIPVLYAFTACQYIVRTSLRTDCSLGFKIMVCLGATLLMWFIYVLTIIALFGDNLLT